MKTLVAIGALLLLAGCESDEDFWQPYHYVTDHYLAGSSDGSGAPSNELNEYPDEHCVAVAQQRARDAGANGYDDDVVADVYRGAYSDCTAWEARHTK